MWLEQKFHVTDSPGFYLAIMRIIFFEYIFCGFGTWSTVISSSFRCCRLRVRTVRPYLIWNFVSSATWTQEIWHIEKFHLLHQMHMQNSAHSDFDLQTINNRMHDAWEVIDWRKQIYKKFFFNILQMGHFEHQMLEFDFSLVNDTIRILSGVVRCKKWSTLMYDELSNLLCFFLSLEKLSAWNYFVEWINENTNEWV